MIDHDPGDEDRNAPPAPQPGDMVRWHMPAWEPPDDVILGEVEELTESGTVRMIRDARGWRYNVTCYPSGVEVLPP